MAYLEAPTDGNGKADRLVCKLDRDLADSLDDCDIRGRCRSDLVNAIVRSFFENPPFPGWRNTAARRNHCSTTIPRIPCVESTGQKPCSPGLPSFTPWRPLHILLICSR